MTEYNMPECTIGYNDQTPNMITNYRIQTFLFYNTSFDIP